MYDIMIFSFFWKNKNDKTISPAEQGSRDFANMSSKKRKKMMKRVY